MEICCLFTSRMPDTVAPLAVTSPSYALLPFALWLHAESQTNFVFRAVVLSRKIFPPVCCPRSGPVHHLYGLPAQPRPEEANLQGGRN